MPVRPSVASIYIDSFEQPKTAPAAAPRTLIESFGDETTLHGALYVFGANRKGWARAIWFVFLLGGIGAVVYTMTSTFQAYLAYSVKTTLSYTDIDLLGDNVNQFPSITLCNTGAFQRVFAASMPGVYQPAFDNRVYSAYDGAMMCPPMPQDNATFMVPNGTLQQALHSVNMTLTEVIMSPRVAFPIFIEKIGLAAMMQIFGLDSSAVVDCIWMPSPSVQCADLFLNHMTDYGWCFTFNPSVDLLKEQFYGGIGSPGTAYGMTPVMRQPFPIVNSGWFNGISLILNAQQDQVCAPGRELSAGFAVAVHDPSIEPLLNFMSPTMLAPGYAINVEIIISHTQRNTESHGGCVSSLPLAFYPTLTTYFQNACYSNCIAARTYQLCGCLPYYAPPHSWDLLGRVPCWFANETSAACNLNLTMRLLYGVRLSKFCAECVQPCTETAYTVQTTFTEYPSIAAFPFLVSKYKLTMINATTGAMVPIDLATFRRNYLYANFYISSLLCATITEDFAMTVVDLVNGIGGALALFIGASLLTIMEIIFCILAHFRYGCRVITGTGRAGRVATRF